MIYREFTKVDDKGTHNYFIHQHNHTSVFYWGIEGSKVGGSSQMVYDSAEETTNEVNKKIRELEKKGYHEIPYNFKNTVIPDPTQNVVEVFRSLISAKGEVVEDYQRFKNYGDVYYINNPLFPWIKYLVCSEDFKKGIVFSFKTKEVDPALQEEFLDFIYANRHDFMQVNGFKKTKLNKPINGMTHCIVIAPEFANKEPYAFPLIANSITETKLIFNCEFPDSPEKLKIANFQNTWLRDPRPTPVCFMRYEITNKESKKLFECQNLKDIKYALNLINKKGEFGAKMEIINFQDVLIEITKQEQYILKHDTTAVTLDLMEAINYVTSFLMGM